MKRIEEIIEIAEDIRLPGTDILLEKGDKIKILPEVYDYNLDDDDYDETVQWYSWAAPALINGDYSGLSNDEAGEVDAFYDWMENYFDQPNPNVIDMSDESSFGRPEDGGLPGDLSTYTISFI